MEALMDRFELTADHVKLLSRASIRFSDGPYCGAPGLDAKRPFGNSDLVMDMAKILGIDPVPTDDEETHYPVGTRNRMMKLYRELGTALSIVLRSGSFEPGVYVSEPYRSKWTKQERRQSDG